jgi:CopG family transcriptional regulator/antitoxin EndoAI
MLQRINITLPEDTLRKIDQAKGSGNRSQFIDEAIKFYLKTIGKKNLKNRLKEGAIKRAARDLNLVEE